MKTLIGIISANMLLYGIVMLPICVVYANEMSWDTIVFVISCLFIGIIAVSLDR